MTERLSDADGLASFGGARGRRSEPLIVTSDKPASTPPSTSVCRNHPDRPSTLVCHKFGLGFCDECCRCPQPRSHCKFRTQCLVTEFCCNDDADSE